MIKDVSKKEKSNENEETKPSEILANYECDGQMTIYDFPEWLPESMKTRSSEHGENKGKEKE